jgi:hypothetical protein
MNIYSGLENAKLENVRVIVIIKELNIFILPPNKKYLVFDCVS